MLHKGEMLPAICNQCQYKSKAEYAKGKACPCPMADIVANGNLPCRELLTDPEALYSDHNKARKDYKLILIELQAGKTITQDMIDNIEDVKMKGIAAMLNAKMPVKDIALVMDRHVSVIYRQIANRIIKVKK